MRNSPNCWSQLPFTLKERGNYQLRRNANSRRASASCSASEPHGQRVPKMTEEDRWTDGGRNRRADGWEDEGKEFTMSRSSSVWRKSAMKTTDVAAAVKPVIVLCDVRCGAAWKSLDECLDLIRNTARLAFSIVSGYLSDVDRTNCVIASNSSCSFDRS